MDQEWQIDDNDTQTSLREHSQNVNISADERLFAESLLDAATPGLHKVSELVQKALRSSDLVSRKRAINALATSAPERLVDVAKTSLDTQTRIEALARTRVFSGSRDIDRELSNMCDDSDSAVRLTAFCALEESPAAKHQVAKTWLSKEESCTRQRVLALVALEQNGDENDLSLIEDYSQDASTRVRAAAREAKYAILTRCARKERTDLAQITR